MTAAWQPPRLFRRFVAAAAALLAALPCWAAAASGVAGTWNLSFDAMGRPATPKVTLAVADGAVTGTYAGRIGEFPLTGTTSDNQVTFDVELDMMGTKVKMQFTGTVDGDTMAGNVDMAGQAASAFKGTRAP